jgi:phage-related baseplate assembly protein
MADLPSIFPEDIAPVQQRLQASLEQGLGRSLAPADLEVLILNTFAYEIQLQRISGNQAYRQNLVDFATGAMLEYLCALIGVTRLAASGAVCTLEFDLVDGHNAVQLPAGVRVQSVDGQVIFTTIAAVDIPSGTNTVQVDAVCQTAGQAGNGYDAGKISIILDPQPFVATVENTEGTSGGNDAETDDQLRSRVKLAPASFSVAGPKGAYQYFAKSADPSIVDVSCVTTNPGEVTLYPLCTNGTLAAAALKDAILAICSDEKVRPQNDTVLVADPSVIEYQINVQLVTLNGAINSSVLDQVNTALSTYKLNRLNKLGMDVVVSQIIALCIIPDQVYKCSIISPAADIVADESTYTSCTGISVSITGSTDG